MKYEVRCCCDPNKLVGWLEMPDRRDGEFRVAFQQPPAVTHEPDGTLTKTWMHVDDCAVTLEVATLSIHTIPFVGPDTGPKTERFQAIKDNHVPLETLKRIPGFTPYE